MPLFAPILAGLSSAYVAFGKATLPIFAILHAPILASPTYHFGNMFRPRSTRVPRFAKNLTW